MLTIYDIICGWVVRLALFIPLIILFVSIHNMCSMVTRTEVVRNEDGSINHYKKRHLYFHEGIKEILLAEQWWAKVLTVINVLLIVLSWIILFL